MLPTDIPIPAADSHTHNHHLPLTGNSWLDKILPFSALAISLISLVVAIHHGTIMNEMAKANAKAAEASVWPFLTVDSGNYMNGNAVYMNMKNVGVGPARLESFQLFYQGKAFGQFTDLLSACCMTSQSDMQGIRKIMTGSTAPSVIASKESASVYSWPQQKDKLDVWKKLDHLIQTNGFKLRGCYCSVFDQCWTTDFVTTHPTPVASCTVKGIQFQASESPMMIPTESGR